jgi:CRP-like cAMP-binding protein
MHTSSSFLSKYHARRFQKGEIVIVQGEIPDCVYMIKSGIIKTYNLTSQGEEKPLTFDVSEEVFPVGWIFGHLKWSQYYYEAFTDCELYCIPRDEYLAYLKSDNDVMFDNLAYMARRTSNFQMRLNALEQSKAINKVINTLHFLCLRFGKDLQDDVVKIDLPLTQQELANFMGLTRETTGIELKKLQKKGIITYRRQNYVVKTDRLSELLDEDYDMGQTDPIVGAR